MAESSRDIRVPYLELFQRRLIDYNTFFDNRVISNNFSDIPAKILSFKNCIRNKNMPFDFILELLVPCLKNYILYLVNQYMFRNNICDLKERQKFKDDLMIITELIEPVAQRELNFKYVRAMAEPLMEIVLDSSIWNICGKEVLKVFTELIGTIEVDKRSKTSERSITLCSMVDKMGTCGDFDYQTTILEMICLLLEPSMLDRRVAGFFPEREDFQQLFKAIDVSHFDEHARGFLNTINMHYKTVLSIEIEKAILDTTIMQPPSGFPPNTPNFWVDFNTDSFYRTVSFQCSNPILKERENLVSEDAEYADWETFTICVQHVQNVTFTRDKQMYNGKKVCALTFKLGEELQFLNSSSKKFAKTKTVYFIIISSSQNNHLLNEILSTFFGDKFIKGGGRNKSINENKKLRILTSFPSPAKQGCKAAERSQILTYNPLKSICESLLTSPKVSSSLKDAQSPQRSTHSIIEANRINSAPTILAHGTHDYSNLDVPTEVYLTTEGESRELNNNAEQQPHSSMNLDLPQSMKSNNGATSAEYRYFVSDADQLAIHIKRFEEALQKKTDAIKPKERLKVKPKILRRHKARSMCSSLGSIEEIPENISAALEKTYIRQYIGDAIPSSGQENEIPISQNSAVIGSMENLQFIQNIRTNLKFTKDSKVLGESSTTDNSTKFNERLTGNIPSEINDCVFKKDASEKIKLIESTKCASIRNMMNASTNNYESEIAEYCVNSNDTSDSRKLVSQHVSTKGSKDKKYANKNKKAKQLQHGVDSIDDHSQKSINLDKHIPLVEIDKNATALQADNTNKVIESVEIKSRNIPLINTDVTGKTLKDKPIKKSSAARSEHVAEKITRDKKAANKKYTKQFLHGVDNCIDHSLENIILDKHTPLVEVDQNVTILQADNTKVVVQLTNNSQEKSSTDKQINNSSEIFPEIQQKDIEDKENKEKAGDMLVQATSENVKPKIEPKKKIRKLRNAIKLTQKKSSEYSDDDQKEGNELPSVMKTKINKKRVKTMKKAGIKNKTSINFLIGESENPNATISQIRLNSSEKENINSVTIPSSKDNSAQKVIELMKSKYLTHSNKGQSKTNNLKLKKSSKIDADKAKIKEFSPSLQIPSVVNSELVSTIQFSDVEIINSEKYENALEIVEQNSGNKIGVLSEVGHIQDQQTIITAEILFRDLVTAVSSNIDKEKNNLNKLTILENILIQSNEATENVEEQKVADQNNDHDRNDLPSPCQIKFTEEVENATTQGAIVDYELSPIRRSLITQVKITSTENDTLQVKLASPKAKSTPINALLPLRPNQSGTIPKLSVRTPLAKSLKNYAELANANERMRVPFKKYTENDDIRSIISKSDCGSKKSTRSRKLFDPDNQSIFTHNVSNQSSICTIPSTMTNIKNKNISEFPRASSQTIIRKIDLIDENKDKDTLVYDKNLEGPIPLSTVELPVQIDCADIPPINEPFSSSVKLPEQKDAAGLPIKKLPTSNKGNISADTNNKRVYERTGKRGEPGVSSKEKRLKKIKLTALGEECMLTVAFESLVDGVLNKLHKKMHRKRKCSEYHSITRKRFKPSDDFTPYDEMPDCNIDDGFCIFSCKLEDIPKKIKKYNNDKKWTDTEMQKVTQFIGKLPKEIRQAIESLRSLEKKSLEEKFLSSWYLDIHDYCHSKKFIHLNKKSK